MNVRNRTPEQLFRRVFIRDETSPIQDRVAVQVFGAIQGSMTPTGAADGEMSALSATTTWQSFTFSLSNPKSITFQNVTDDGTIVIINYDDPGAASVVGRYLTGLGHMTVTLDPEASTPLTFWYRTVSGTATVTADEIN